jgi:molecular chaperone DnaK
VDHGEPVDLELLVIRDEYEREVGPLLDRARACVRTALTAGQLKPSAIDRVLLVGGTTYMPCVRQLVAELFNKEPKVDPNVHPDTAVATGAAVQAALAGKMVSGVIVADGSPFGIGVDVVDSDVGGLVYSELMAPNTKIPFSVKNRYSLRSTQQKELELTVYQDHFSRNHKLEDKTNTQITAHITDIPPALDGTPHAVEVKFAYDINGVIVLEASIPATGQKKALTFDKSLSRPSAEEKASAKQQVDELWTKSPLAARYEGLIARANAAADAAPAERAKVEAAVAALQDALKRNDEAATKSTSDALTDLLFDIQDAA